MIAESDQPRYDGTLLFIAGALMTFGVAIVYSASVSVTGEPLSIHNWWNTPLRQSVFAVLGFCVMVAAANFDYRWLSWTRRGEGWRAALLASIAAALLIAVLIPGVGTQSLGATRSIVLLRGLNLGFQPSEFAKVVIVIWLAALLSRGLIDAERDRLGLPNGPREKGWLFTRLTPLSRNLFVIVSSGLLIGLTGIEDFGTAALMGVVMMCMLFFAGMPWRYLLTLIGLGAGAAIVLIAHKPYRMERIKTFLDNAADPQAEGYQIAQALIAIGSGGWWGRGLGAGVQKYGYLPQDNNDFVLAIVCEEIGVAGGIAVAIAFLLFLIRGWMISSRCGDPFGRLLAAGLTLTICVQAAFNIGVVTNSVPTKGISLPFVSAGGSGVLFLGAAAGLIASVARGRVVTR